MKKILFIIHKSTEGAYKECIRSIEVLKRPSTYVIKCVSYGADVFSSGDAYAVAYQSEAPDISVLIDDTMLFVDDNFLNKIVEIFQSDFSVGLIGIKGAAAMPGSGVIDDAEDVYGGFYEMNCNQDVIEKKYASISADYIQVEAISSIMVVVRGYLPVWAGISSRCIGEVMSVVASIYGYKAVVPQNAHYWCFSTIPEAKLKVDDVVAIQRKFKFKDILLSKKHYLLTISIPTFNRSRYFSKCISNICRQAGNVPWVEIFVSDNASTDDTEKIAAKYYRYRNFRYYKQPVNIGAGKNYDYLYENAYGDFVVACGDDDYYSGEAILNILEAICLYPNSTIMELEWPSGHVKSEILHGSGLDNFVVECTTLYTCISCAVLNQKRYMNICVKDRFAHTRLNQCYTQLEMLRHAPDYALLRGNNFRPNSGEASQGRHFKRAERFPFCEIFVREYYPILDYFLDKGLSRGAYEKEKVVNLNKILAWLHLIKQAGDQVQWWIDDDLEELMAEFYGYEPYYEELKREIRNIKD